MLFRSFKFAVDKKDGEEEEGALADVAPTVLDIMVRVCVLIRSRCRLMFSFDISGSASTGR